MPDRDYYLLDEPAYRDYRSQLVTYIGRLLSLGGASEPEAGAGAQTVMAIETQLAQAQWSRVENRDPIKTYNPLTLAQASKLAPQIDWSALFCRGRLPGRSVRGESAEFSSAPGRMTGTVPVGDWRIYFRYKLLDGYAPFLSAAFDELYFDFHQRTSWACSCSVRAGSARWRRSTAISVKSSVDCTWRGTSRRAPGGASGLLVGNLLQAYARSLDQLDWMGPQTRAQAQLKLSSSRRRSAIRTSGATIRRCASAPMT